MPTLPNTTTGISSRCFRTGIVHRIFPLCLSRAGGDHGYIHIAPLRIADSDDPTVSINVARLALDRPPADQTSKLASGPLPAGPSGSIATPPGLIQLRRVDSKEPNTRSGDVQSIAIANICAAGKHTSRCFRLRPGLLVI